MSRALEALLRRAENEAIFNGGRVSTDTMMKLGAEGYGLDALDDHLADNTTLEI